jgi:hypothetical protein
MDPLVTASHSNWNRLASLSAGRAVKFFGGRSVSYICESLSNNQRSTLVGQARWPKEYLVGVCGGGVTGVSTAPFPFLRRTRPLAPPCRTTTPPLLRDATSELRLTGFVILLLLAVIRTQCSQRARKRILARRAERTAARTRSREGRPLPWTPPRGGSQVRGLFERSAGHFGTGTRSLNRDG